MSHAVRESITRTVRWSPWSASPLGRRRPSSPAVAGATAPCSRPAGWAAAASFDETYGELIAARRRSPDRIAEVSNLVLQRDLGPVHPAERQALPADARSAGRTVGRGLRGAGTLRLRAPIRRSSRTGWSGYEKARALDAPVTAILFLFADTHHGRAGAPAHLRARQVRRVRCASSVQGRRSSTWWTRTATRSIPTSWARCSTASTSDLFYAHISRQGGGAADVPLESARVRGGAARSSKVSRRGWGRQPEVITQFPRQGAATRGEPHRRAGPTRPTSAQYTIETTLTQSGIGELGFAATGDARDHGRRAGRPLGGVRAVRQAQGGFGALGRRASPPPSSAARRAGCSGCGSDGPHAAGRGSHA